MREIMQMFNHVSLLRCRV